MIKTKELIICIISIMILVLAISTDIFATDSITDINALTQNLNNSSYETIPGTTNNSSTNNINSGTNNSVKNIVNNSTNNSSKNVANKIPYTGSNGTVIIAVVAVCGIVGAYAYKKIRDYNV